MTTKAKRELIQRIRRLEQRTVHAQSAGKVYNDVRKGLERQAPGKVFGPLFRVGEDLDVVGRAFTEAGRAMDAAYDDYVEAIDPEDVNDGDLHEFADAYAALYAAVASVLQLDNKKLRPLTDRLRKAFSRLAGA